MGGLGEEIPRRARQACPSGPRAPSARITTRAATSVAGLKPVPGDPSRRRPAGAVSSPTTRFSCMSRDPIANPGNTSTPSPSACSPSHRAISESEAVKKPWFRMVGGVGTRIPRRGVRKWTLSRSTRVRNGNASSSMPGNSSRNATGLTTAPERQCPPSSAAFSKTQIEISSPAAFAVCASRIAAASPAGPPPTIATSKGSASGPGARSASSRSTGSGGRVSRR